MKIAVAQLNPVIGDFFNNTTRMIAWAKKAKDRNCDLVVFPELSICGYPPLDLLEDREFIESGINALDWLVNDISGIGVIVGCVLRNPDAEGKRLYNSAVFFENGRILHQVNKSLLPAYDVFDESRYFEPGKNNFPLSWKNKKIGLTICEDVWNDKSIFPNRLYHTDPVEMLIQEGAGVLINISASVFHHGKPLFRSQMLSAIAMKYGIPLIYANQVGGADSVLFDGVSMIFDQTGKLCARAKDFEEDMVIWNADDADENLLELHDISESTSESVLKALIMGVRDYVSKCGFHDVVIGLSGGIDSALVLAIACMALGSDHVRAVFMPSRYTSRDNYVDTAQLAKNFGVICRTIPIDMIFQEFIQSMQIDYQEDNPGVTEQNIQARIRGSILMAVSNANNSLVLSTGNKSELAVGYCTLYGDMNGGLAVISDVPKTMVYEIARFINIPAERIPKRILEKAPSAELKPNQTDQDDLPAYDILDAVLKAYVEDLKTSAEIIQMGFDQNLVRDIISRIDKNEYKRYQAAPGLKITSRAFGFGRRYPLAKRHQRDWRKPNLNNS
ncbi:MAG: NAD+ synthase [Desulfatirhabdiaceae bacterium]